MKDDDLMQIAAENGFHVTEEGIFSPHLEHVPMNGVMRRFANAILERAAVECHQGVARMSNDIDGTAFYIGTGQCAKAIRALKINTGD